MGVAVDRAASSRELQFAGFLKALIDAGALVLAGGLAGDAANLIIAACGAVHPVRPAHSLKESQRIIFSFKLSDYVYQVHNLASVETRYFNFTYVSSA